MDAIALNGRPASNFGVRSRMKIENLANRFCWSQSTFDISCKMSKSKMKHFSRALNAGGSIRHSVQEDWKWRYCLSRTWTPSVNLNIFGDEHSQNITVSQEPSYNFSIDRQLECSEQLHWMFISWAVPLQPTPVTSSHQSRKSSQQ